MMNPEVNYRRKGGKTGFALVMISCILASVIISNLQYGYLPSLKDIKSFLGPKQDVDVIDLNSVPDGITLILSTLQPEFHIPISPGVPVDAIDFRIDDSLNILEEPFLKDRIDVNIEKKFVSIHPHFVLFPGLHKFSLSVSQEYSRSLASKKFILAYFEDFSSNEGLDYLWKTSDNWSITENKKLLAEVSDDTTVSDISFRTVFPKDLLFEFDFTPFSNAVNISVSFDQQLSFFIGDGDGSTIRVVKTVQSKSGTINNVSLVRAKVPFIMQQDNEYRVRITRIAETYRLFISEKSGMPMETTNPVLTIGESESGERLPQNLKILNIAVWRGNKNKTTGAIFDNVLIYEPPSPLDIEKVIPLYSF